LCIIYKKYSIRKNKGNDTINNYLLIFQFYILLIGDLMDKLLEKEEKYKLWDFKVGPLHLWPLIRSFIISKYLFKKGGFTKPHNFGNKFVILLPQLWMHHLRTFNLLNFNNTCFDVLFFTTAVSRYFNEEKGFYENRLYGRYFDSFSKSLNFENNFRGFFPSILPKTENTYISETLNILLKLNVGINKKNMDTIKKDEIAPFLKVVNSAFPGIASSEYTETVITKNLNRFPIIKQFYFNKIIPRIKNKIAFIHCASYLGSFAILTKILHSAGFKVIEVQHGTVYKKHYAYNYPQSCIENINHQCREYLPDYLLMFGEYWVERVRTPSKKIVVGYPYLNKLSKKLIQKISPEPKTILIVSQGPITERMVNIAAKLSRAFSDYKIIFKLHPGEIPFKERYKSLKGIPNLTIVGNCNIYELISKSNIVIGHGSTTLFEALKFPEKRIFIGKHDNMPDGIGYKFSNIDELIEAIKDNTKGYQKANPEYFWASNWEERFREFMRNELNLKI